MEGVQEEECEREHDEDEDMKGKRRTRKKSGRNADEDRALRPQGEVEDDKEEWKKCRRSLSITSAKNENWSDG